MSIEWLKDDYSQEEKEMFLKELPLEVVMKAYFIERVYGSAIIVKSKEGSHEIHYFKGKEELIWKYEKM